MLERASVTRQGVGGRQQTDRNKSISGKPQLSAAETRTGGSLRVLAVNAPRRRDPQQLVLLANLRLWRQRMFPERVKAGAYGRFGSVDVISHRDCTHRVCSSVHELVFGFLRLNGQIWIQWVFLGFYNLSCVCLDCRAAVKKTDTETHHVARNKQQGEELGFFSKLFLSECHCLLIMAGLVCLSYQWDSLCCYYHLISHSLLFII